MEFADGARFELGPAEEYGALAWSPDGAWLAGLVIALPEGEPQALVIGRRATFPLDPARNVKLLAGVILR